MLSYIAQLKFIKSKIFQITIQIALKKSNCILELFHI